MSNILSSQAYLFCIYLISGIIIGILFDIFRILRKSFKTIDFITYIEDIIFWILTGLFIIFILFKFSNGEIRIYNIIALLVGCILYLLTINKFFIKINVIVITFIKHIICKIVSILMFPFKVILKIIRKIFKPFTFFVINFKKVFINFKKKQKNGKNFRVKRRIFESNVEK